VAVIPFILESARLLAALIRRRRAIPIILCIAVFLPLARLFVFVVEVTQKSRTSFLV
jgi:hypothetical protein